MNKGTYYRFLGRAFATCLPTLLMLMRVWNPDEDGWVAYCLVGALAVFVYSLVGVYFREDTHREMTDEEFQEYLKMERIIWPDDTGIEDRENDEEEIEPKK